MITPARANAPAPVAWVVCLCADWCGTCREYQAVFKAVAGAHPMLNFAWVDVEDHADIADDFDIETFPSLLIASQAGTHFLGPLLPKAETLTRLLASLPRASANTKEVGTLLAALESKAEAFSMHW